MQNIVSVYFDFAPKYNCGDLFLAVQKNYIIGFYKSLSLVVSLSNYSIIAVDSIGTAMKLVLDKRNI